MGIYENLKYAKYSFAFGLALAITVPIIVLHDQKTKETDRKKNILVDSERMRRKLEENPNLSYKKTMDILPIKLQELRSEDNK